MAQSQAQTFFALHQDDEPFILPNVWDAGSAKLVERAGFPAIATTSAGIAYSHGVPDGNNLDPELMFAAVERIVRAVSVPVTMDMETGYGDIARTIARIFDVGAVGANLEDAGGEGVDDLFDLTYALEAIGQAKDAIAGRTFVLNARCDAYLTGQVDALDQAVMRGRAYAEAGADCVFIPGVVDYDEIRTLVSEIKAPINILGGVSAKPLSLADYRALGVRRISTGGSLMRATYAHLNRTLNDLSNAGSFDYAVEAIPDAQMGAWMGQAKSDTGI